MQNQEKIIQAIAAYLEENTEHIWHSQGERMAFSEPCEYPVFSEQSFLKARAASIAAAIAPHMEAGSGIQGQEVDRDEFYTEKFKEWREKYFTPDGGKRRFTSKSNGVLYDDFGLQEKFKRAYNLSPIK